LILQLHDLLTGELALRIGGNKTGLLNVSLVSMTFYMLLINFLIMIAG